MNVFKPMASLSSELLARKGGAMPASLLFPYPPAPLPRPEQRTASVAPPEPLRARRDGGRCAEGAEPPRRHNAAKVSLRLDPERHHKLRLAALHQGQSGQQILIAALDAYLKGASGTIRDGQCTCLRGPGE